MSKKLANNVNTQPTEIEKQTNYDKGFDFEKEFADFLKKDLRYRGTVIRRYVPSSENSKLTNVDVIGFKTDSRRKENMNLGIVIIVASILAIAFKAFYTMENQVDDASLSTQISFILMALFLLGCFFLLKGYKILADKHAWVECKNLKDKKATFTMIKKMFGEYEEYKKSPDNEYNFTELYFVSANGFVDDALKFAKNHNIRCFVKDKNDEFIEI